MKYLIIILSTILVNNVIFSQFLGICPFLGTSKKTSTALGMGAAVIFVLTLATLVTWLVNQYILIPLGLDKFMQTIAFILIIAALVQMVEIILKKISPSLYTALGVFLPLITTNCAVLGVSLTVVTKPFSFVKGEAAQLLCLGEDGAGRAAPFATAREGDHAVGAEIVAAAHDGDEAGNPVGSVTYRHNVIVCFGFGKDDVVCLLAGSYLFKQAGQRAVGIGTGYKVEGRLLLQNLRLQPLGHAPQQPHHHAGMPFLDCGEVLQSVMDALFGIVTYRAGVDEDQIC